MESVKKKVENFTLFRKKCVLLSRIWHMVLVKMSVKMITKLYKLWKIHIVIPIDINFIGIYSS
ncbi:hypothetical protein H5410_049018, partial [Solanum commersonii]